MYLLVVIGYFLIVFVKFEYKIYDVNESEYVIGLKWKNKGIRKVKWYVIWKYKGV